MSAAGLRARPLRRPGGRGVPRASAKAPAAPVEVPIPPRRLWALLLWGGGGLALAAAAAWSIAAGLDRRLGTELVAASARAGFTVRQVRVSGNREQDRLSIYAAVLADDSDALLGLDLPAIRARVEALPWIATATVSRRWPDAIVVEVAERRPMAIWQLRGRLSVIDAAGEPLAQADPEAFRHLPLVVGPGANRAAGDLLAMLDARPELAGAVLAAVFVGERRWDLRLATGETLSLPEGEEAARALARLAALERAVPVRGQGFVRLDLRVPDRLVLRLSPEQREAAGRRKAAEARARAEAERRAGAGRQAADAPTRAPAAGTPAQTPAAGAPHPGWPGGRPGDGPGVRA